MFMKNYDINDIFYILSNQLHTLLSHQYSLFSLTKISLKFH